MVSITEHVLSLGKLKLVVFTGGEPFLLGDDLLQAVKHCSEKKLLTRIVTNAYWATNPQATKQKLLALKEAGLSEINLSCDDYHQEFIPIANIKNANDVCTELGIPCLIGHKLMKDCKITISSLAQSLGHELAVYDPEKPNPPNNLVSTGYTVPIAENMHLIPDEEILYPQRDAGWTKPCSSILQRIVITPKKELSICCGMVPRKVPEIVFGTLDEFSLEELIVKAHEDLIVNWLALEGPFGMMQFLLKKNPNLPFRKQYVNVCHLCSEILTREDCRTLLKEHAHEKKFELSLERALYDYMRTSDEIKSLMIAADVPHT